MLELSFHHVAFGVRNMEAVSDFYEALGFKRDVEWEADDGSMRIVLLRLGAVVIELFDHRGGATPANTRDALEEDIATLGIRHYAFRTHDLAEAIVALASRGMRPVIPMRVGRTGNKIAFFRDPEGNWIELVEEIR